MRRPGLETREISRMTGSPSTYFNSILSSAMPGRTCSRVKPRMYPSGFRTSKTLARIFEAGAATTACRARCPLRMRVSMSPSGSLIVMARLLSPVRLQHARDLVRRCQFPHRDARQFELAVNTARAAGQRTAVANASLRAVARQLGQLQLRLETLLRRRVAIARDRLQPLAARVIALGELGAPVVLFDRTLLSHRDRVSAGGQFWKGISKPRNNALASASVLAVVTMTISMPRTASTLS